MRAGDAQRVQTAIARAAGAVAPIIQHEFQSYGPEWLERVNTEPVARGQSMARGVQDHRFVLGLVGHHSVLAELFDEAQRDAGRRLNGMGNALAHNEPLRNGVGGVAEGLAQRLIEDVAPLQQATDPRVIISLGPTTNGGKPEG